MSAFNATDAVTAHDYVETGAMHIIRMLQLEGAYHLRKVALDLPPHIGDHILKAARDLKTGVCNSTHTSAIISRLIDGEPNTRHFKAATTALRALYALGY